MLDQLTLASSQFDAHILDIPFNLSKIEDLTRKAVSVHHADLVLFPEAALTGYCFSSPQEVWEGAVDPAGPEISQLKHLAAELNVSLVFGAATRLGDVCHNTVFFLEPDWQVYQYHKSHLPFLGLDKFVEAGDRAAGVFHTRFGSIGLIVCYELRFPETARVAALEGARLILQPTNLPVGGESHPDFLTRARACENRVPFASCNRVGTERGFTFIGRSQVIDREGNILAEAHNGEEIISATLDLTLGEDKDIIGTPGEREMYLFRDRRPSLYETICHTTNQMGFVIRP